MTDIRRLDTAKLLAAKEWLHNHFNQMQLPAEHSQYLYPMIGHLREYLDSLNIAQLERKVIMQMNSDEEAARRSGSVAQH